MEYRTCADCDQRLTKKPGPGRWPTRCDACRSAKLQARSRMRSTRSGKHRTIGVAKCGWCYDDFDARTDRPTFCSVRCASLFNRTTGTFRDIKWVQCEHCHVWLTSRSAHECLLQPPEAQPRVCQEIVCPWCDVRFMQRRTSQIYCSSFCKGAVNAETFSTSIYYAECRVCGDLTVSRYRHVVYCSKSCRRRSEGKFWVPQSLRDYVYERDRWRCQLCNQRVGRKYPVGHDRGPSLDHVVPRSAGGSDAPENLQLAHRICNSIKQAKTFDAGEQLRLVG